MKIYRPSAGCGGKRGGCNLPQTKKNSSIIIIMTKITKMNKENQNNNRKD